MGTQKNTKNRIAGISKTLNTLHRIFKFCDFFEPKSLEKPLKKSKIVVSRTLNEFGHSYLDAKVAATL